MQVGNGKPAFSVDLVTFRKIVLFRALVLQETVLHPPAKLIVQTFQCLNPSGQRLLGIGLVAREAMWQVWVSGTGGEQGYLRGDSQFQGRNVFFKFLVESRRRQNTSFQVSVLLLSYLVHLVAFDSR